MFKKLLIASLICSLSVISTEAAVSHKDTIAAQTYFEKAEYYSKNNQYSTAIDSLKKGLRLNPYANNIRISLINNYLLRATYYNNTSKEYTKAMNDLRSALFYLKYYGLKLTDESAQKAITDNTNNLNQLYKQTQIAPNLKNRYQIAKNLRADGEFAASAYEFFQSLEEQNLQEDSYIQLGELFTILGNHQQSIDYYKKALAINGKKASTHLKLAKAYDAIGEAELANREYNYTLSVAEEDKALMLELESIWIKKIGINANNAEAHTNLGAVYQKLGDYQKALQEYSKAKALNPKNLTTRFNMGTLYQTQKEYQLAVNAYDEVLQFEPKNEAARYYKAVCLSEMKQFAKATDEFRKLLELKPNDVEIRTLMLENMSKVATDEEMLNNYATAIKNGPVDGSVYYNYAYLLHKANRLNEAISNYNLAIQNNAGGADAYINLAQVYKQKRDFANASKITKEGLAKYSNNSALLSYFEELKADSATEKLIEGSNLYKQGKFQDAIAQYMTIEPKTADVYLNLGACYQAMNEDKKAIEYYKQAMIKDSNNSDIALYLGQAYLNLEDWDNAKSYLGKAVSLNADNQLAKDLYNYVIEQQEQIVLQRVLDLYSKGQYSNALAVLNNLINQNKNNAFAYYYRGMIFDAQKKYSLAVSEYQKMLSISNSIPEGYYALAVDYEYLNQPQQAFSNYKKYLNVATEENEYTRYAQSRIQELSKYEN